MTEFFETGYITGAHGIKGDVRVFPVTDDPGRFSLLKEIIVKKGAENRVYKIETAKRHKQFVIIKLSGVNTMNEALALKGATLLVKREQALPLSEDEYYIPDLTGMEVVSAEGEALGLLTDVIQSAANDVYVIKKQGEKDLLVPAIKSCIKSVDIADKKMTVVLPEGLR